MPHWKGECTCSNVAWFWWNSRKIEGRICGILHFLLIVYHFQNAPKWQPKVIRDRASLFMEFLSCINPSTSENFSYSFWDPWAESGPSGAMYHQLLSLTEVWTKRCSAESASIPNPTRPLKIPQHVLITLLNVADVDISGYPPCIARNSSRFINTKDRNKILVFLYSTKIYI